MHKVWPLGPIRLSPPDPIQGEWLGFSNHFWFSTELYPIQPNKWNNNSHISVAIIFSAWLYLKSNRIVLSQRLTRTKKNSFHTFDYADRSMLQNSEYDFTVLEKYPLVIDYNINVADKTLHGIITQVACHYSFVWSSIFYPNDVQDTTLFCCFSCVSSIIPRQEEPSLTPIRLTLFSFGYLIEATLSKRYIRECLKSLGTLQVGPLHYNILNQRPES